MKRPILMFVALASASLLFASDLWAHGGQFRGPGGAVPPNLREPSDPTPPPPPPPSAPPTTPSTPATPARPSAPSTGPVTGPSGGPPITGPSTGPISGPQRGRRTAIDFSSWRFWFSYNKDRILNLKEALYEDVNSSVPIFGLGGGRRGNQGAEMHDIRQDVEEKIIPTLIWAMDPKNSGYVDTESAAYIALAKCMTEPSQIQLIKDGLDLTKDHEKITHESAALALGMLRREDPDHRFSAADLDKVREFLFEVIQNDEYQTYARGFAAMSIGLLGDQPTGTDEAATTTDGDSASMRKAKETTQKLFDLLKEKYSDQEMLVAILTGIGLQQPDTFTEEQREVLRECVLKGRLFKDDVQGMIRSYATLTLGRIGTKADIQPLSLALTSRRNKDLNVQRSAAIALGLLADKVTGEARVALADTILSAIGKRGKVRDAGAINFGYISLAYILNEEEKAEKTDVIEQTKIAEFLLEEAEDGKYMHRPYAALALGLNARQIGDLTDVRAYGDYRKKGLEILRAGVGSSSIDKDSQAAFACALGIAKDSSVRTVLTEFVADTKEDTAVRGYAALALGMIGESSEKIVETIRAALKDGRTEEMRVQCATALGLLRDKDAVPMLLEELKEARTQSEKGQFVLAIARVGRENAVDPLIKMLRNPREKDLTRALCCAGLGVIADLELIPTLARISENVNYRGGASIMNEVLSII